MSLEFNIWVCYLGFRFNGYFKVFLKKEKIKVVVLILCLFE